MTIDDVVKCQVYNEFYRDHKDLYKRNIGQYWSECRMYVDRVYRQRLAEAKETRREQYDRNQRK